MTIWLYHINPKNRYGYTMGWDISRPSGPLRSSDRIWAAGTMFNKVTRGDTICVFMKNIPKSPDGIYIVGTVRQTGLDGGNFSWSVDRERGARTVLSPIATPTIRKFFPRSYGGSMQPLAKQREKAWFSLLGRNKVFADTHVVNVRKSPPPRQTRATGGDPEVSRENGLKGERHVLALLRREFSPRDGYRVEHVAAQNPAADHDISIRKGKRLVRLIEVKTRFGKPPDPVLISDRELSCRRQLRGKHAIFIVYLGKAAMFIQSCTSGGKTHIGFFHASIGSIQVQSKANVLPNHPVNADVRDETGARGLPIR
ncbi:MAG: DUF3883 domain-containing protein [Pseudomonadota bacterium]